MEKQKLPNATLVLVLGILSILTCCCWGVIGLILGIVALNLAKKDMAIYYANPEDYSNYSNISIGRVLSIIGIVLSSIYLIFTIYLYSTMGSEGMQKFQKDLIEKMQHQKR